MPFKSEWQPIETAPKAGTEILLWLEWGEMVIARWKNTDPVYPWSNQYNGYPEGRVDYWMPLPEPPDATGV